MKPSVLLISILLCFLISSTAGYSQALKPGFDKGEYIETLRINNKAHIALEKWKDSSAMEDPKDFHFVYRSPRVAFDNIWDLWISNTKPVALIAVQGSIQTQASFLANLYAAMIPATGELQLGKDSIFQYQLATNPNAAVHVGWTLAMAYMSYSVLHQVDSCYKAGIKDFILTGHSQGGGITFILTAYLHNLQSGGKLPADIHFKTYCSAGPKPGNLDFAYDYEKTNEGGWAYNVVNAADWVPDVPFSVQTVSDFTVLNPFTGAKKMIKKQKFPKNLVIRHVYNRLSKPSYKAVKNYRKWLGRFASRAVKKQIPGFRAPEYFNSNYYVRTGSTVVLTPDSSYFKVFDNRKDNPNIWQNHLPRPYLYLAEKLDPAVLR